jgi:hypothetical protein
LYFCVHDPVTDLCHSGLRLRPRVMEQITNANQPVQPIAGSSVVSMNTDLTFHRSGTGPAGRRAGRVPSLSPRPIHPPLRPAIADGGRSQKE